MTHPSSSSSEDEISIDSDDDDRLKVEIGQLKADIMKELAQIKSQVIQGEATEEVKEAVRECMIAMHY